MTKSQNRPAERGSATRQAWLALLLMAAVLTLCISLAAQLASNRFWIADVLNLFVPHIAAAGLVLSTCCVIQRGSGWRRLGMTTAVTVLVPILWAHPLARAKSGGHLRVITANLFIENTRTDLFSRFIAEKQPDILVTQETDRKWLPILSQVSGLAYQSSDLVLSRFDMKLMSRYPITSEQVIENAGYPGLYRQPVRFEIETPFGKTVVYAVHPNTLRFEGAWADRNRYIKLLADALRSEPLNSRLIVLGDFNTPPWSPFFREILAAGDLINTDSRWVPYPTRFSLKLSALAFLGTPIDHILVGKDFGISAHTTGPQFGSNHLPVISDVALAK